LGKESMTKQRRMSSHPLGLARNGSRANKKICKLVRSLTVPFVVGPCIAGLLGWALPKAVGIISLSAKLWLVETRPLWLFPTFLLAYVLFIFLGNPRNTS